MSMKARLLSWALAGLVLAGASATSAAQPSSPAVLWLLVFLRIDGFTDTQVLPSQDQCEEQRFGELLSRRPKWKPEIRMISECVPVRMQDIRLKSSRDGSP